MKQKNFARKLDTALEFRNLTRKELAVSCGVKVQCIGNFFKDSERELLPSRETLAKICDTLQVSAEYFFNDTVAATEISNFLREPEEERGGDWMKEQMTAQAADCVRRICRNLSREEIRSVLQILRRVSVESAFEEKK